MTFSFWEQNQYFENCDVVIAGAGIVGLSTAIYLKKQKPKLKVLVLEKSILPNGASTKNAGFACFGSVSEILDDLNSLPENEVLNLIESRWKGLQNLKQLLSKKELGLIENGGFEVFRPTDKQIFEKCAESIPHLNKSLKKIIGPKVFNLNNKGLKSLGLHGFSQKIDNPYEAQINTGLMMHNLHKKAIALDVKIINGLGINSYTELNEKLDILTDSGFSFSAKRLVICTNGFARKIINTLPVEPARAQVLITKPIKNLKLKGVFHYNKGYYYFRNVGNRVLLGGARNLDFKTENTFEIAENNLILTELKNFLSTHILHGEKFEIEQNWAGIMGVGINRNPILEQLGNQVFCAVRLGGMGVAIGSLLGKKAAKLVLTN